MPNTLMTSLFFFFNDTATTEIYTLSLHDALPIWMTKNRCPRLRQPRASSTTPLREQCTPSANSSPRVSEDRKSTRLNSSHLVISYAVFCLKKKSTLGTDHHEPRTIADPSPWPCVV